MKKLGSTRSLTHYFGQPIGNGQDPDEPYDRSADRTGDGYKLAGKGSQGGGSQMTPQARRSGSGALQGSYPKSSQRLRG